MRHILHLEYSVCNICTGISNLPVYFLPVLQGQSKLGNLLVGTLRVLPPLLSLGDLSYRSFQGPVPVTSQRLSRDR